LLECQEHHTEWPWKGPLSHRPWWPDTSSA
jgi:hypothetical protein